MRENIPPYQEAHARRQAVQVALNREAERAAGEIEMRLASAQAVTQSLDEERKRLRADNAVVNAESVGLNELEREAEGKRQRYEALLTEYNTADNNAASQTPHARIVSQAALPLKPSAPRKPAVFGAAVIFSAALGMFIALMHEVSRRTVRTPEELHAAANLRPIGVIPRIGGRRKEVAAAMRTIVGSANSIYAEAMRSLRAELSLSGGYDGGEVIAVTSPGSAAGKAALAAGLARSIALTGARTLLIDADLRHGEILPQLYQRYTGPDFASVLRDTVNWAEARLSTKIRTSRYWGPIQAAGTKRSATPSPAGSASSSRRGARTIMRSSSTRRRRSPFPKRGSSRRAPTTSFSAQSGTSRTGGWSPKRSISFTRRGRCRDLSSPTLRPVPTSASSAPPQRRPAGRGCGGLGPYNERSAAPSENRQDSGVYAELRPHNDKKR